MSRANLARGKKLIVAVMVSPRVTGGRVILDDGSRTVRAVALKHGEARAKLRLRAGSHRLSASFLGSGTAQASKSSPVVVKVLAAHKR